MSLNLVVFGSSIVSAYWNGAATYYRGMCRALSARGHRIRFVEQDIYDRQGHRDLAQDPPYCEVRVVSGWEALERELRAARAEADLIVKGNDSGAFDREMETWLARNAPPVPVAFWDVDAPATLAECAAPDSYLRPLIPSFACVFTYGGGEPVVAAYRALGARRVVPVYNAVDAADYHPVPPDAALACDVLFMGNRLPDREARFRHYFLGAAGRVPEARFVLGGAGWEGLPLPPNVRPIGHCPTALHPALNCSARLVLNLNREAMAATGFSPPTRVFEAARVRGLPGQRRLGGDRPLLRPRGGGAPGRGAGGPGPLRARGGPGRGPGHRGAGPPPGPARPQLRHPRRHLRAGGPGGDPGGPRRRPGGYIGGLPIRAIRAIVPGRG